MKNGKINKIIIVNRDEKLQIRCEMMYMLIIKIGYRCDETLT